MLKGFPRNDTFCMPAPIFCKKTLSCANTWAYPCALQNSIVKHLRWRSTGKDAHRVLHPQAVQEIVTQRRRKPRQQRCIQQEAERVCIMWDDPIEAEVAQLEQGKICAAR